MAAVYGAPARYHSVGRERLGGFSRRVYAAFDQQSNFVEAVLIEE
jgi:hypothetical protein